MKRMALFVAILSAMFVMQANAEQKITGAFGVKLGCPLSDLDTQNCDDEGCIFTPTNPISSFDLYTLTYTPKTRRVFSIAGSGDYPDQLTCKKEMDVIVSLLEKKYGKAKKVEGFMNLTADITQGRMSVHVRCENNLSDVLLSVVYLDVELAKLNGKERIELESKKRDASGL